MRAQAARLPDRYCFLVAKDGFLVHEQYQPGFSATDTYEGDSAMKTVNALMFGVAVSKGKPPSTLIRTTRSEPGRQRV